MNNTPNELTDFRSPTTPDEGPVGSTTLPRQRKRAKRSAEYRAEHKRKKRRHHRAS